MELERSYVIDRMNQLAYSAAAKLSLQAHRVQSDFDSAIGYEYPPLPARININNMLECVDNLDCLVLFNT